MKVHYLYKITRLSDGAFYIGRHSAPLLKNNYLGGGKHISASVRKYGKDAHRKEILQIVNDAAELRELEKLIVNEALLDNPLCLNIALGGDGGFIMDRATLSNQSKKNWENPEYREKLLATLRDGRMKLAAQKRLENPNERIRLSDASKASWTKDEYRTKLKDFGKYKRSESTLQKMSSIMSSTVWVTNGQINKRVSTIDCDKFLSQGFRKGITKSWL